MVEPSRLEVGRLTPPGSAELYVLTGRPGTEPGSSVSLGPPKRWRWDGAAQRLREELRDAGERLQEAERRRHLVGRKRALAAAREAYAARVSAAVEEYRPVHDALRAMIAGWSAAERAGANWRHEFTPERVRVFRVPVPDGGPYSTPDEIVFALRSLAEQIWIDRIEAEAGFEAALGEPAGPWWERTRARVRAAYVRHAAREERDWDYETDGSTVRVFRWHRLDPPPHTANRPSGRSLTLPELLGRVRAFARPGRELEVAPEVRSEFADHVKSTAGRPVERWWAEEQEENRRRAERERRISETRYSGYPSGGFISPPHI
jgi:hypothetical protein